MGASRVRTPKHFVLEERLERYSAAIIAHPQELRGHWLKYEPHGIGNACTAESTEDSRTYAVKAQAAPFRRLHLDLGCGKGSYLVQRAESEPETLFVGLDQEPICIAYAAQKICEARHANTVVAQSYADTLPEIFAPGEVDAMTLNFPTPEPKTKHAAKRLVYVDRLVMYRSILAHGATLTLRTDSQPLRDYALGQFVAAGYSTLWTSDDVRAEHPEHPETEYERRTREMGAKVYGICATLGAEPTSEQIEAGRAQEQSLMRYLPDDLESLTYVPLGMEDAVTNFRNRIRKGKKRLPQDD